MTTRPGSIGSAARTYSRQPSSSRKVRIKLRRASRKCTLSFDNTWNEPCTITIPCASILVRGSQYVGCQLEHQAVPEVIEHPAFDVLRHRGARDLTCLNAVR